MEDYETPLGEQLDSSMEEYDGEYGDDGLSDVEADAMTLASAGWGTDEDYFHDSFDSPY